jgi:hypothetical protein
MMKYIYIFYSSLLLYVTMNECMNAFSLLSYVTNANKKFN